MLDLANHLCRAWGVCLHIERAMSYLYSVTHCSTINPPMQRGRAAPVLQLLTDNENVPLTNTPLNMDQPDDSFVPGPELDDEDVYGVPSDDEMYYSTLAQPILSSRVSTQPRPTSMNEDDVPLGSRASLDICAAHERIIQQEKQAQSDKTLKILEGKASPKKINVAPQRSRSIPHRRRNHPQIYAPKLSYNNASTHPPSSDATVDVPLGKLRSLQRSATHVRKMESQWKLADSHIASPSTDVHGTKILTDKTGTETQMRDVTMAMSHLSATRIVPNSFSSVPPLRVFLQNVQKYTMVPMVENATVITVLHQALVQNGISSLKNTFDEWVLYDVIPEWGLERPLREYERIDDIVRARGRDAGFFLIKLYNRPDLLRTDSIPPFSSVLCGPVSIRLEQGKWCKKWLELREHSLFIAKDAKVCTFFSPAE